MTNARFKPATRTYVRPMDGWWRRNPYFIRYMIREGSAVFLSLYALMLLAGLIAFSLGEGAYDAWLSVLASPISIMFHVLALLVVCYHSYTWFKVMPKTLPSLPVPPRTITRYGIGLVFGLSVLVLAAVRWFGS